MTDNDKALNCVFHNENVLFLSFMPFVKDGGLFVHTQNAYELDALVTLSITLFNEPEVDIVEGKVIWVTPKDAQGNKPAGIGVQFISENKRQVHNKIEKYLTEKLKSVHPTDTM